MIRTRKDKYGNAEEYEFYPTSLMLYVVEQRGKPENIILQMKPFLIKIGRPINCISKWKSQYNIKRDHKCFVEKLGVALLFDEWFEDAIQEQTVELKERIRLIGIEKAKTDYPYWEKMAKTLGVIKPEQIEQTHVVIPIDLKTDLTLEQLEHERDIIMARLRGDEEGSRMAISAADGQKSPARGTYKVQEGPVVLPDKVGDDDRRPRSGQPDKEVSR